MPGGTGTFLGGERYGYDAVGNPAGQGTGVDTGNRLTTHEGYTLEYDADGNVTRKYRADGSFDQRLVWNSLGQLVQVWTSGVGDVYLRYDGWGRRIQKLTPTRGRHYIYDGEHVFLEGSECCIEAELTYYPGTDQPHSIRRFGAMYYYQTDALGSVVGLTGGANEVVNRYVYTPWGSWRSGPATRTTRWASRRASGTTRRSCTTTGRATTTRSWGASSRRTRSGWRAGSTRTRTWATTRSTSRIRADSIRRWSSTRG